MLSLDKLIQPWYTIIQASIDTIRLGMFKMGSKEIYQQHPLQFFNSRVTLQGHHNLRLPSMECHILQGQTKEPIVLFKISMSTPIDLVYQTYFNVIYLNLTVLHKYHINYEYQSISTDKRSEISYKRFPFNKVFKFLNMALFIFYFFFKFSFYCKSLFWIYSSSFNLSITSS